MARYVQNYVQLDTSDKLKFLWLLNYLWANPGHMKQTIYLDLSHELFVVVITSLSEILTEISPLSASSRFLFEEVFSSQIIWGAEMTHILS